MMLAFHFLRPWWLLAFLPAVLIAWVLWRRQDQLSAWRQVIDPDLLPHLLVGRNARGRFRPIHALALAWALTILALSGPTWSQQASPFASDEAGLVILLNVSGTMNATDVQPSRLERAKHKLQDLLARREGAASALIVYSGTAHLVMPLTKDTRVISAMIEDLTPGLMPRDGDALAAAIRDAAALLDSAGTPGSVVVMADAIAPSQAELLASGPPELPVQFLAVQALESPTDPGIARAARAVRAPVVTMTVDTSDVDTIAGRARNDIQSRSDAEAARHWKDSGYAFLPLIALLAILWSRKGWVVS